MVEESNGFATSAIAHYNRHEIPEALHHFETALACGEAELLIGLSERIHWYSLFDLPRAWPATTRHREAEGSSYYRHFYMGLLREDGTPKKALRRFFDYAPALGICQWFHFQDYRLSDAAQWMRNLGVRHLRTGLSWADSFRPDAAAWFDRQMKELEDFE